jgi:hypothetical protein
MEQQKYDFLIPIVNSQCDEIFCPLLGNALKQMGYRVLFITTTKFGDKAVEENNHTYVNINELSKEFDGVITEKLSEQIRQKYDIENIRKLYFGEWAIGYFKKKEKILSTDAIKYMLTIEKLFTAHSFGCVIHNQGSEIIRRVLDTFGKKNGVPNIYVQLSPIHMKSFFFVSQTPYLDGDMNPFSKLTKSEIDCSIQYLKEVTSKKELLCQYFKKNRNFMKRMIENVRSMYNTYLRSEISVLSGLDIVISKSIKKLICNMVYPSVKKSVELCKTKKYFFFPIQFYGESRTTVFSPNCFRQEYIIDLIARSIPNDHYLFLKDHPDWIGDLPYDALKQIRTMKNVFWLNPKTNTHQIIENCSAVTTINGSVGYEAILYGKEVITFGKEFYTHRGITKDIVDLSNLDRMLLESIKPKSPRLKMTIPFLALVIKNSHDGVWGLNDKENVERLTKSILNFVKQGIVMVSPDKHD